MTEAMIRAALPHLAKVEQFGTVFRITTENGYYIKMSDYDELEFKTVGWIMPTTDLSTVQIVAEADLPDDYVINGDTGNNETETE